jgi:predicted porin
MAQWSIRIGVGTLAIGISLAHAQNHSGVTIGGNVDVSMRSDTGSMTTNSVTGNSLLPSRITISALEDLGNGYQAQVILETGFRVDDGTGAANPPGVAAGAMSFGRFAGVALGSERTGYLSAGRQYTPLFVMAASGVADVFGGAALGGSVLVSSLTTRASNSLAYTYGYGPRNLLRASPPVGLGVAVMLAPGESPTGNGAGRQAGFNVSYGLGPWWGGYGFHQISGNSAAINPAQPDSTSPHLRQQTIATAYNFGNVKLNAGFNRGDNGLNGSTGVRRSGWYVGTSYVFGGNQEIKAFYGRVDDRRPLNADFATYQLAYIYNLSKRTQLYTLAGVVDNSASSSAILSNPSPQAIAPGMTARSLVVGVLHRF